VQVRPALAAALLAAAWACSADGGQPVNTFVATGPGDVALPLGDPPGRLDVVACRWRAPGVFTYDLHWRPAVGAHLPATVGIELARIESDMLDGVAGTLTVGDEADIEATVDFRADDPPPAVVDEATWAASRADVAVELAWRCGVRTASAAFGGEAAPVLDPFPVVSDAPAGTVDALAAAVDLADQDDPLLPLALLLRQPGRPGIDHLVLAVDGRLEAISIQTFGRCTSITSTYSPAGVTPPLVVDQSSGCSPAVVNGGPPTTVLPDPSWDVVVSGAPADVDALVAALTSVPFADPTPPDAPPPFDADAAIDARLRMTGQREVVRFDWNGGRVAAVATVEGPTWGEDFSQPIVEGTFPSEQANDLHLGGTGTSCRGYSWALQVDGRHGFLLVVTEGPGYSASVTMPDGGVLTVDLEPALGPREAGLLDLPPVATNALPVRVVGPDGIEVPCVQR
jgi:hypothetical protein